MSTRHSGRRRAPGDFYVEPDWADRALFDALPGLSAVHDPCCGLGTIVEVARQHGIVATGADNVDRTGGRFPLRNFLEDTAVYPNVCTNPPFKLAARIVQHALTHVVSTGFVAVLVPLNFLASQGRFRLFTRSECYRVLLLSRRPSMPPSEALLAFGEAIRGNGSTDFCWIIWQRGFNGEARISWSLQ